MGSSKVSEIESGIVIEVDEAGIIWSMSGDSKESEAKESAEA